MDLTLILATGNPHKVDEIQNIIDLPGLAIQKVTDLVPSFTVIEDSGTFRGNALKKAREAYRLTGLPSLADDSGLEVDGIGGKPGVYSSRFAGPEGDARKNNEKLLALMQRVPEKERTARFRCVMALVHIKGEEVTEGIAEGRILTAPRGLAGFGYDPLFLNPETGRSFAELSQEDKNRISHRGRALRKMRPRIVRLFGL